MIETYARCYRVQPNGRLERIPVRDLDIRYGTRIQEVCTRLRYEHAATIELGNTGDSEQFHVEVHVRYDEPDPEDSVIANCRFLVGIVISAFYEYVFVEDLPDLIPFLAQLAPVAHASFTIEQEILRELDEADE